ncbi:ABC transporter substrate-binding protein [Prolixibacter bellariivorans]|uniref:ABC transporter substrate-binding protein n=1 Tax=Prolixibacter bellariivorans TaxID=314319 RepID=A0A5M4B2X1_9BACT|nr:MlaD family protein [Prolixibacter bellariivorans]GET34509.1 ABC transporter substrate-binding protein [Prolixibacter bellariivorans]
MDTYTEKFKVRLGLFIIGGVALFILAIFIIGKQQNLFSPVFKLTTTFHNVSGLQVGNNVRFTGINVGTVDNIKIINDSTVQVDMLVKKDVQQFIKSDCQVAIGSEGLIGDRLLIISYGSTNAPIVEDGQQLTSKEPIETDAIMASLQTSAVNAETITQQLAEIMMNINSGQGALGRLIQDSTIAENINQTIENLKKSSEGVDETIKATKENLFAFMESLQKTAGKTEVASNQLGEIMVKINSGEGTLGMLIQDSIVAGNLDETITNLKHSSQGLDENMEALKHNFLFRRYFRRKAKKEERLRIDSVMKNANEKDYTVGNEK